MDEKEKRKVLTKFIHTFDGEFACSAPLFPYRNIGFASNKADQLDSTVALWRASLMQVVELIDSPSSSCCY